MKTIQIVRKVKFRKPFPFIRQMAIFLGFLSLLFPTRALTQQIDVGNLVLSRLVYCPDLAYTTTTLLQEYHQKENKDTLLALMNHWEYNCSMNEPMLRFKLLYMIETNSFYEDWYPENILEMLEEYREQSRMPDQNDLFLDYRTWDYFAVHHDYREYTRRLAEDLKHFKDLSPLEQYFLEFYSENFREAKKMRQSGKLAGTKFDQMATGPRRSGFATGEHWLSLSGGIFQPTGSMQAIGALPHFGLSYGLLWNKLYFNLFGSYTKGNTSNTFLMTHLNTQKESYVSQGWNLGFELGYEIMRTRNSTLLATAGGGGSTFKANHLGEQNIAGFNGLFSSPSANLGLTFKRRFLLNAHAGLNIRYHFINFENNGGTDLSGNFFTVGLLVGLNY